MKIHIEVWLAAAEFHERAKVPFSFSELQEEVGRAFGDRRPGVGTYIVSNANASAKRQIDSVYNYILRSARGSYRLCKAGDPAHPSRVGCPLFPDQADVEERSWWGCPGFVDRFALGSSYAAFSARTRSSYSVGDE